MACFQDWPCLLRLGLRSQTPLNLFPRNFPDLDIKSPEYVSAFLDAPNYFDVLRLADRVASHSHRLSRIQNDFLITD
jgi:hypothetical protein